MTARVSRERRAQLSRKAHVIRGQGQRAGWPAARIAAAIQADVPDLLPMEAWRLAYGWTRPQAIAGITALYTADGLAAPPLNSSMLCRWEHGDFLSALAGNLAFHLGDAPAAQIHLSTAARLGTACGDARLTCWSLGAQSMTARAQRRPAEALDLARQAIEHAATPLQRAQVLSWAELPALVGLGPQHRSDALRVIAEAQDQMSADPDGAQPGRFGFDNAELELHIAEASLVLGDHALARAHAQQSQAGTSPGRPSWAAATLILARAEAARGRYPDAAALAHAVLDEIPAASLRETSRARLRALDRDLATAATADPGSRDLAERLRALPSLVPVGRLSDEPNGTH